MIKAIELRQLHYFVVLAEELNFGRAAKSLGMSQPPLSRQIQQLEKQLDVQLFERNHHSVQLTVAGRVFLAEAQKTLEQMAYSVEMAQRASRGDLGQLVLGIAPMLEVSVYPALEAHMRKAYPHVQVQHFALSSAEQASMVRSGHLDAGLVRLPLEEHDFLTIDFWFREPLVVMMRDDNPLANRRTVKIVELSGQNRISIRKKFNPGLYGYIDTLCHRCGYRNGRLLSVATAPELPALVLKGAGIAIIPISFERNLTKGLSYVRVRDKSADVQVGLIYRRLNHPPLVRLLQRSVHQMQWPKLA